MPVLREGIHPWRMARCKPGATNELPYGPHTVRPRSTCRLCCSWCSSQLATWRRRQAFSGHVNQLEFSSRF